MAEFFDHPIVCNTGPIPRERKLAAADLRGGRHFAHSPFDKTPGRGTLTSRRAGGA